MIGSSSLVPSLRRSWTSLLVEADGDRVLVDAGSWRLLCLRRDVLHVSRVYITHRHPDHSGFLGALIRRMKRQGRTSPLHIFHPSNASRRILRYIRIFNPHKLPSFLKFHSFKPGRPRLLDRLPHSGTEVWAASACHTTMTAAYSFNHQSTKIVIAPDTSPRCPPIIELARGATALFHDCTFSTRRLRLARRKGHSSPEGAGYDAAIAGVQTLILIHISGVRTLHEQNLITGAARHFPRTILVAHDNQTFIFPSSPSPQQAR